MSEIMPIVLTIVVITGILALTYIILSNNLLAYKIKVEEAEGVIDDLLEKKYELLNSTKDIITENTDIDHKVFANLKKIKNQNLSFFNLDKKLNESHVLIEQIKEDFSAIDENEQFNEINDCIYNLNEKLEATKNFYNKYAECLNSLAKKVPVNMIAKVIHIEPKAFFK